MKAMLQLDTQEHACCKKDGLQSPAPRQTWHHSHHTWQKQAPLAVVTVNLPVLVSLPIVLKMQCAEGVHNGSEFGSTVCGTWGCCGNAEVYPGDGTSMNRQSPKNWSILHLRSLKLGEGLAQQAHRQARGHHQQIALRLVHYFGSLSQQQHERVHLSPCKNYWHRK